MKNTTFKGYYVIVDFAGNIDYTTMSCMRKWCIENFIKWSSMTWKDCKKSGWSCVKVDVTFSPSKNSKS